MRLKGVNYDVGRLLEGHMTRQSYDAKVVHRELEIIRDDLHCNSVKIQGFDIGRVMMAAEDALKLGLDVWVAPEMFEESEEKTLAYVVEAAAAAEALRARWPDRLVFSIGTELTLFMQGILPGTNLAERLGNPALWGKLMAGAYAKPLNQFLARANEAVRPVFGGPVTYASVARVETVDWSIFDCVCVDAYRDKMVKNSFGDLIRRYLAYGKPVVIGEFGCCTYKGAEDRGGMGWDVVDWSKTPPRLKGDYVYDQAAQAREIAENLRIFDEVGVEGAFVFTFVQPAIDVSDPELAKMLKGLEFDPDIASYSLVRSYQDKRGIAYPDMMWEPKESFGAVAAYFAGH